jgi:hypothetical protein
MAVNANSRERIGRERAWRGLKSGGTEVGKLRTLYFLGWSEVVRRLVMRRDIGFPRFVVWVRSLGILGYSGKESAHDGGLQLKMDTPRIGIHTSVL